VVEMDFSNKKDDPTPWIGVDLDGVLVIDEGWKGASCIGAPIVRMIKRVQKWMDDGQRVKIFTARANPLVDTPEESYEERMYHLKLWIALIFKRDIEITYEKDLYMIELWDDRCVQVELNTGRRVDGEDCEDIRPDRPGFWRVKEKPYKGITYYRVLKIIQVGNQFCVDPFLPLHLVEGKRWFDGWAGMVSPLVEKGCKE
jgi:hypothetical protein